MPAAKPVTLKLHHDFYSQDAIDQAMATFADFASFAVRLDGDHFVVDVNDINQDVEGDVVAEFCNFALANAIAGGKSSDA